MIKAKQMQPAGVWGRELGSDFWVYSCPVDDFVERVVQHLITEPDKQAF